MILRTLFTTAFIASSVFLSACSNNSVTDAPSATSEVTMDVQAAAAEQKPAFSTSISTLVTATVLAIDHKTRLVTFKDAEGKPVTFTAAKEVRNLEQVNTGDTITAEYVQNFSIEVLATANPEAASVEIAALSRAEKGEKPGMAIAGSKIEVLAVEEINLEASTFKLKDAGGTVREFTAHNPENMKKFAVGDAVVITYSETLAISVKETAAK